MGNYIKILMVAITLVFMGCKDWLDVTPAGQATENDLFSTGSGYRSVLNGLYKSMGNRSFTAGIGLTECWTVWPSCINWMIQVRLMMRCVKLLQSMNTRTRRWLQV